MVSLVADKCQISLRNTMASAFYCLRVHEGVLAPMVIVLALDDQRPELGFYSRHLHGIWEIYDSWRKEQIPRDCSTDSICRSNNPE
jgi:hypothetical protein